MVLVAATVVAVVLVLAMRDPTGPIATLLEENGMGELLSGTDRTARLTEVPLRPRTPPRTGVRARAEAAGQVPPSDSTPSPEPDPAPPTPSSGDRVGLGTFPVFGLTADGLDGPLGLESARVSVVLPDGWRQANGQFFDRRGQKVGEIGPGPFEYTGRATCATPRVSEMNGPPMEEYRFDFESARGTFRLTEGFCGGGTDTYAGACWIHSYCVEPGADGLGLLVTFLELSPTPSADNDDLYGDLVDSIQIRPEP